MSLDLMTPTSRETMKDSVVPEKLFDEPLDSLSVELGRISAEIHSINSGFQAQMQQVVAEVRAAAEEEYRLRLEKSVTQIREEIQLKAQKEIEKTVDEQVTKRIAHLGGVKAEIARIGEQLEGIDKDIATMLDDPNVELSKVMRKRTEQSELRAYLNGLRFSIGE